MTHTSRNPRNMSEDGHGFHLWLIISIFVLGVVQVYTTQDRLDDPYKSTLKNLLHERSISYLNV